MSRSSDPRFVVEVESADGLARLIDAPVGHGSIVADDGGFRARLDARPIDGEGLHLALEVTRSAEAGAVEGALRLAIVLGPADDPWPMIPGVLYGENRPEGSSLPYPAWRLDPDPADEWASDRWLFRADRAATPMTLASDGERTVALVVPETGELGLQGLEVAATHEATEVAVWAPFQEQPVRYDGSPRPQPGVENRHPWGPGETRTLEARAYVREPDRYAFAAILRTVDGWLANAGPDRPPMPPWTSLDRAAALAAEGLRRWHWREADGVLLETAAFERGPGDLPAGEADGDRLAMHVAWLSGVPAGAALLAHGRRTGDAEAVGIGERVIDGACANLAPAGTFWGQWTAERGWTKGWTPGDDRLHARTLAVATLFTVRAVAAERAIGLEREAWAAAAASNLAFAAAHARDDGALGSAYHGRTGTVESWDGTAGLAWVPALVEGASVLGEAAWMDVARAAGGWYARFVERAFLHGAPEDVELAPTSEDGYVAVMAYVALARAAAENGERRRWLGLAAHAADWTLTFRYAYDVAFPPRSIVARHGYRSRGMDQASVANQHLHVYGLICTEELAWLGRALDDAWLVGRARDHFVAARQLLVRDDGELNGRRGMLAERVYQTDCFGPKGGMGMLSHAWCLGLLLWACEAARADPELADDAVTDGSVR
jgi:hypothetical protein